MLVYKHKTLNSDNYQNQHQEYVLNNVVHNTI